MKFYRNFAQSSKQTFIDMLKEARLPCHNSDTILNSLNDDLGEGTTEDEVEAISELVGWLELIYDFEDLEEGYRDNTLRNLVALGADCDKHTLTICNTQYIKVDLTPLFTDNGFQFDVYFKRDQVRQPDGTSIYPATINGVVASRSMQAHIENFAMYLKLYKI